jgi:outer membrane biosynthesis protein TonB
VRTLKRITGFLALAACLLAAGCRSDNEGGTGIPRNAANALENQLDSIQDRFEFGGAACNDISNGDDPNTTAVQKTIDNLPGDVDQDVRNALEQGFDRLFQLVQEQCKEPQTKTETETVTEPPPTPTVTQTETTPPETTETTPPPSETTEPPPTNTEQQTPPGQGGNSQGGQRGNSQGGQGGGGTGQGGDGTGGVQGGSGGGALVPGDEG